MSSKDLEAEGQTFLDKIIQQYAYQQIMSEMQGRGFSVVDEKMESDGRIRIRIRKFE